MGEEILVTEALVVLHPLDRARHITPGNQLKIVERRKTDNARKTRDVVAMRKRGKKRRNADMKKNNAGAVRKKSRREKEKRNADEKRRREGRKSEREGRERSKSAKNRMQHTLYGK